MLAIFDRDTGDKSADYKHIPGLVPCKSNRHIRVALIREHFKPVDIHKVKGLPYALAGK